MTRNVSLVFDRCRYRIAAFAAGNGRCRSILLCLPKHTCQSAKLSSRASPPRYITNAKSIVHFAAATRPVFVGLPANGHTERCKLECTRNWMKCDIGSNVISASSLQRRDWCVRDRCAALRCLLSSIRHFNMRNRMI